MALPPLFAVPVWAQRVGQVWTLSRDFLVRRIPSLAGGGAITTALRTASTGVAFSAVGAMLLAAFGARDLLVAALGAFYTAIVRTFMAMWRLVFMAGILGYMMATAFIWFFNGLVASIHVQGIVGEALWQIMLYTFWLLGTDFWVPVAIGILPAKSLMRRLRISLPLL